MPYQGRQPGVGVRNRFLYTATASQTTFSGADDNGRTLAYQDGAYVDVYLNGVMLVPGTDFTATTKTSVSLTSGAAASDIVEIIAYDISSIADTVSALNGGTFSGNVAVNGNLTVDTNTLFVDAANNRVGVGTSSPAGQDQSANNLVVEDAAGNGGITIKTPTSAYGSLHFSDGTGVDAYRGILAYNHSDNSMQFHTNATERARIDASGNMAIGQASTTGGSVILDLHKSGSAVGSQIRYANDHSTGFYVGLAGNTAGEGIVYNEANAGILFATNNSERMRIDASGNVGIGTASPSYTAAGRGNLNIAGSGSAILGFQIGGTAKGYVFHDNTNLQLWNEVSGTLLFGTNGSERARIDASGNLLVGSTASNGYKLRVDAAYNAGQIGILTTGRSGGEYPSVGYNVVYGGSTGSYARLATDTASMVRFNSGQVETLTAAVGSAGSGISFTQGPYVAQGGTSWTNGSSDVRQKKNFEPTQGLSALLQVEPVKYHFDWEEDSTNKRLGFKAQNLRSVIPEMVMEKAELADDGTPYLTITPDYILPVLVKAIQDQQAIIEALEARITALEGASA